ncbi:hypothetical protein MRX96_031274 [Rhipicephalus microplus]
MKSFWRPLFAKKKVLFSGEDLQSKSAMSSEAKIHKKKLEKISMPNYSQTDPNTFRTSMHMEVVEDNDEGTHETQQPSENASTIVIQTTPKSPDGPSSRGPPHPPHQQRDKPAKPGGKHALKVVEIRVAISLGFFSSTELTWQFR